VEDELRNCHQQGFTFYEVHALFGKGVLLLRDGKTAEARPWIDQGWRMREGMGSLLSMDSPTAIWRKRSWRRPARGRRTLARSRSGIGGETWHAGVRKRVFSCRDLAAARGDKVAAAALYRRFPSEPRRRGQARSWQLRSLTRLAELRRANLREAEARFDAPGLL
jgi:hypothetical protein